MIASLAAGGGGGAGRGGPAAGMRELDTEAPVIWPAWCYSAEGGGAGRACSRELPAPHPHLAAPLKTERLSPHNESNLSRSRSVTPSSSSYPGTPPERNASPAAPVAAPARNYSDIMRSLAARYNHHGASAAHTDFLYPSRTNGFPALDARLAPKPPPAPAPHDPERTVGGMFAGFAGGARALAFPAIVDMSSTKALLALSTAARGSVRRRRKRCLGEHTPLDLSAGAELKRRRASGSSGASTPRRSPDDERRSDTESREEGRGSGCAECACAARERLAAWAVDDVCEFVRSIDICAEYAPKFREQRIDGSGLPLLTEEHLTGMLGMKLGPALKLRATLRRRQVCTHLKLEPS